MSLTRCFSAVALAAIIAAPGLALAQTPAPAEAVASRPVAAQGDLVDTLKLSGQFTTFVKGIDSTNLAGLLKTNKNLTVFAPTDAAFAAMPAADLTKITTDKTAMQKFILHHIVNAPIPSSKIKGVKGPIPTGAGDTILLDGSDEGGALKVDGATIVQADLQTSSGLLQIIDQVLVAGYVSSSPAEGEGAASGSANP